MLEGHRPIGGTTMFFTNICIGCNLAPSGCENCISTPPVETVQGTVKIRHSSKKGSSTKCPNCGRKIRGIVINCPNCGEKIPKGSIE